MKYQCDIINDLMLSCAEGTASAEGRAVVRTHLSGCSACAKKWKNITGSRKIPENSRRFVLPKKVKAGIAAGLLTAAAAWIVCNTVVPFVQVYASCGDTPEAAIEKAIEKNSFIDGPYDADQILGFCTWGQAETESCFYWMLNGMGYGKYYVDAFHGRYLCGSVSSHGLPEQEQVCQLELGTHSVTESEAYRIAPVYVRDPAVRTICFAEGGKTVTEQVNEKGFCLVKYPIDRETLRSPAEPAYTGEALDADGRVLYTLTEPDWANDEHRYQWLPVQT